jgi:Protein of unknown function (DUF4238)
MLGKLGGTSMSEPRQHHGIPAFYLAGFTASGTRDDSLHVYDYPRHRHYGAKPEAAARERDFNRVYEPNEDPNIIERDLGRLENELAPVLRSVLASGRLRGGHELGELLSLVAMIHARGPKARRGISLAVERTMRRKFEAGVVRPISGRISSPRSCAPESIRTDCRVTTRRYG